MATKKKGVNLWRNLFFLFGIPAILLVNANIMFFEEHHPKRADFAPYEYMRKRSKRFPWGDGNHSLFHNEYYNALPEGYETPDDYLEKLHGHEEKH
jgi:cytochrome c oxidase subunit 6a